MSYTILSIAYPFTHVGPDASGGSEQILSLLDRGLVETGHRSLVLAVEGSDIKGELIPSPRARGQLTEEVRREGTQLHRKLLREILQRHNVDLVHMHSLDFHQYLPPATVPTLATLHLPADWYPQKLFTERRKNLWFNCVSQSQYNACPASAQLLPPVRNGLDLRSFSWRGKKQPYVLSLGRICPEKGFHLALDAARQADVDMILAGELFPYADHVVYFNKEILPRLDSRRKFIGPLGAESKRKVLKEASAVLVPSLVAETCSLVTMEALASGSPVVAFPAGAIPELVRSGQNGFLVRSVSAMAKAIRESRAISPAACRSSIKEYGDHKGMLKRYLAVYRDLARTAAEAQPRLSALRLPWLPELS